MATGGAPRSGSGTMTGQWFARLRRLWMTPWKAEPVGMLDALAPDHRQPVAGLAHATMSSPDGVALLLDHQHPDAMKTLGTLRATHAESFEAGAIVVGIENLPAAQQADLLASYRRVAQTPVFAVDRHRAGDRLLLRDALVATRVAAALCRHPVGRSPTRP